MVRGRNKAGAVEKILAEINSRTKTAAQNRAALCVFISHKREDTAACEQIANYIMDAGIDVYFDKYDKTLSQLVREGNPNKVTERIQEGIENSSHMLCVVSPATVRSYWVPFEVGYGYRRVALGILTLKGVSDADLPDYMKTTAVIRGTQSLNEFISRLLGPQRTILESRGTITKNAASPHPLDNILNWQL